MKASSSEWSKFSTTGGNGTRGSVYHSCAKICVKSFTSRRLQWKCRQTHKKLEKRLNNCGSINFTKALSHLLEVCIGNGTFHHVSQSNRSHFCQTRSRNVRPEKVSWYFSIESSKNSPNVQNRPRLWNRALKQSFWHRRNHVIVHWSSTLR